MLRTDLVEAVKTAVKLAVSPIAVDDVSIVEGQNYVSESVLYMTIDLPDGTGPVPGDSYMNMLSTVNQVLIRSGEERTPLFRTVRQDDEESLETGQAERP